MSGKHNEISGHGVKLLVGGVEIEGFASSDSVALDELAKLDKAEQPQPQYGSMVSLSWLMDNSACYEGCERFIDQNRLHVGPDWDEVKTPDHEKMVDIKALIDGVNTNGDLLWLVDTLHYNSFLSEDQVRGFVTKIARAAMPTVKCDAPDYSFLMFHNAFNSVIPFYDAKLSLTNDIRNVRLNSFGADVGRCIKSVIFMRNLCESMSSANMDFTEMDLLVNDFPQHLFNQYIRELFIDVKYKADGHQGVIS